MPPDTRLAYPDCLLFCARRLPGFLRNQEETTMEETIQRKAANAAKKARRQGTTRASRRKKGVSFLDAIYKFETSYPGGITADTLFDERTERIIGGKADDLVSTGLFPQHERDDVKQTLRLALMHEMSNFKPSGCRYTFAATVCANYGKNLMTKRTKELKVTNGPLVSLSTPVEGEDGLTLEDALAADGLSPSQLHSLREMIERLVDALDAEDRHICRDMLNGYSIREIASSLRRSRSYVTKRLTGHIRETLVRLESSYGEGGAL